MKRFTFMLTLCGAAMSHSIILCSVLICLGAKAGHAASNDLVHARGAVQAGPEMTYPFDYCGDANDSLFIDIDDAVYLLAYIFQSGPGTVPYSVASGDADGSCRVDIDDVVYIVSFIFCGGPPTYPVRDWIEGCGECLSGDPNDDGIVNRWDLALMDSCMTHPELCPDFPPCCADADNSGVVDMDDYVYIWSFIYVAGPPPLPPSLCLY